MNKIKGQEITQKDMDRFESKIFEIVEGKHVGCYETTCCKMNNGYSVFTINGKNILAHRLMYQIHYPDEDIDDKQICHKCDNPACVNPDHLFSGTPKENSNDRNSKGRQAKGSKIVLSKLTESDIVEMVNLTLSGDFTSYYDIAKHYNVSENNICEIINQKLWIHVTKDFDMVKIKSLLKTDRKGSKSPRGVFTDTQIREIRLRLKNGETQTSLTNFYHVGKATISFIATGKSYKDVV